MPSKLRQVLKVLGPGLLFAGASIGVSHVVQSTKAGAIFGFALLWAVVLANVMKYPFFRFGPMYSVATGESLVDGYKRLGKIAIGLFVVITIGTIFTVQAAVTVVTAGITSSIFGFSLPDWQTSAIILIICVVILVNGKYRTLDSAIKIIIVILVISTVAAVAISFANPDTRIASAVFEWDNVSIVLLIGLMGWMPSPIDLSVWNSLWTLAKNKQLEGKLTMKNSLLDFNIGYWGAAIMAVGFLSLGALIMFNSGETFSSSGKVFAGELINMYTSSLGGWTYPIIAIAAFTTMFSTTLACLDAIPRVMQRTTKVLFPAIDNGKEAHQNDRIYWIWMSILVGGTIIILGVFISNMTEMVMIATILSFLTAPILATMNYLVITGKNVPENYRPSKAMRIYSLAGLIFLVAFAALYISIL